jgi:UDP-xylose/UDP-N-acetylglucosamine transporter B4
MTPELRHRGSLGQKEQRQGQTTDEPIPTLDSISSTKAKQQQQQQQQEQHQQVHKIAPTRSPSWISLAALTMQVSLQDWILIATMIFGGCCSNVFALEILVK